MKFILKTAFIVLISFLLVSCNSKNKKSQKQLETATIKYAKGFDIQHFKTYSKLIIKAPFQNSNDTFEFILTKQPKNDNELQIPLKKIVVTSTTHIPMLELLNSENKLIGFPNTDFVSSEKTRTLINNGQIVELGNSENINTELLIDIKPEVVVGFTLNSNNKMYANIERMGIPVIFNGDWLEETPLGRAEWIKFFGLLFDKSKQADSIFNQIEKNYLTAKSIALKSKNKPIVLSGGLYKDVWYLPAGESFEANFLKDANTNYLWQNSKGKGSLALNIESVFEKGKDADIWLSPGFYKNIEELEEGNSIYSSFKAYQNQQIYSYSNNTGETGGIMYFELSPTRPDLVLKDIIKITHPELLTDYEFTFFEKLN